ncbi:hypothetical protein Bbelb_340600 [Branchiostoma belcheri]|nr:hypothetical protein Bbelb_340600 [Branchiostoma belcheri]
MENPFSNVSPPHALPTYLPNYLPNYRTTYLPNYLPTYPRKCKVKDESAFQVKIPVCHGESLLLDRTDRLAIAVPRSTITEDVKIPVCHGESLLLDRTDRLAIAVPRSTITEDTSWLSIVADDDFYDCALLSSHLLCTRMWLRSPILDLQGRPHCSQVNWNGLCSLMSAEAWVRAYMRMRNATVNYDRIFLEIVNYLEKGPEDFDKMDVVALAEALVEHAESAEIYDMEMWRRKLWQIKVCAGWEECYQIWYDYSDYCGRSKCAPDGRSATRYGTTATSQRGRGRLRLQRLVSGAGDGTKLLISGN